MAGAFFRHRGLIAFSAGGAMAEAIVLSYLAPSARPLAPQVTALPPLAAYHDLRWLFAFNQSWLGFTSVLVVLVVVRAAVDAVLIQLAWPRQPDFRDPEPGAAAFPDLRRVLHRADRAGRAGVVAGGHADVRGGPAPVLLALPGRGPDPARHRGGAEPGRRGPGLVAAAAPGTHRGLGARDVRDLVPGLGADGVPGYGGHRGRGRAGRGAGRAGLVRAHHRGRPPLGGKAAAPLALARHAPADPALACTAGPAGCRSRRWLR